MLACTGRENSDVVHFLCDLPESELNAQDDQGRTALMHAILSCDRDTAKSLVSFLLQRPGNGVNTKDKDGMAAIAHAVIAGVLASAGTVVTYFYFHKDGGISVESRDGQDGRRRITLHRRDGPSLNLFEVPEVGVQVQVEVKEHNDNKEDQDHSFTTRFHATAQNSCDEASTGMPTPHSGSLPPAPWKSHALTMGQYAEESGDSEKRLEAMAACGLGLPWRCGWMVEGHEKLALQLLNHPGIEDCGFGYLRHASAGGVSDGNQPTGSPT